MLIEILIASILLFSVFALLIGMIVFIVNREKELKFKVLDIDEVVSYSINGNDMTMTVTLKTTGVDDIESLKRTVVESINSLIHVNIKGVQFKEVY